LPHLGAAHKLQGQGELVVHKGSQHVADGALVADAHVLHILAVQGPLGGLGGGGAGHQQRRHGERQEGGAAHLSVETAAAGGAAVCFFGGAWNSLENYWSIKKTVS
jgi:hypothetical protein